jgi:hypothetical protein
MNVAGPAQAKAWLSGQLAWRCATGGALTPALARAVLRREYLALLSTGYAVPPAVVLDLATLYSGADVQFMPPSWTSDKDRPSLEVYCTWMNAFAVRGPLVRAMERAREVGQPATPDPRSIEETLPGLLVGLETVHQLLPRFDQPHFPPPVQQTWRFDVFDETQPITPDGLDTALAQFFVELRTRNPAAQPEAGLLPLVATIGETAAEGLDHALLREALTYPPLPPALPATLRRLQIMTEVPHERVPRAPEGNDGITRRGSPSAVLRSYLARPDFFQRLSRGDVLYYRRHAATLDPQRMLLVWVIERNAALWDRPAGSAHRRDAWALRVVLRSLEDAARHFGAIRTLDLQLAVIVHDGAATGQPAMAVMSPSPGEVARAADHPHERAGWIPQCQTLFPELFIREPELQAPESAADDRGVQTPPWRLLRARRRAATQRRDKREATAGATAARRRWSTAALNALDRYCALEAAARGRQGTTGDSLFTLAQAIVLGRPQALPTPAEVARSLAAFTTAPGAATVGLGEATLSLAAWPRGGTPSLDPQPYSPETVEESRRWIWNHTVARFRDL